MHLYQNAIDIVVARNKNEALLLWEDYLINEAGLPLDDYMNETEYINFKKIPDSYNLWVYKEDLDDYVVQPAKEWAIQNKPGYLVGKG